MNWFKDSSRKETLKKLSWDFKNQEMVKEELGDTLRYTMDSHNITIGINKSEESIMVSLTAGSSYIGTYILDYFWSFDLKEEDKSKTLYSNLTKTIRPILKKFVKENIPTSLLCPFIRNAIQDLGRDNLVITNIPIINYSYDLPIEKDWRSTIYGTRYPSYKEQSFKQYTNNSIYSEENKNKPTGKFAL